MPVMAHMDNIINICLMMITLLHGLPHCRGVRGVESGASGSAFSPQRRVRGQFLRVLARAMPK